jgi:hypothetical protein
LGAAASAPSPELGAAASAPPKFSVSSEASAGTT